MAKVTLSGKAPNPDFAGPAPQPPDPMTGQYRDYWVLSPEDRAKGFMRPVRLSYRHDRCGKSTKMNQAIAESFARDVSFYSHTYCATCGNHYPVGPRGEFTWLDSTERVGT